MSVHSEYGRALEALMGGLQRLETAAAQGWVAELELARVSQHPDLSAAATACMRVLDAIDAERSLSSRAGIGPDHDPLRAPFTHLLAHCRAVLGSVDSSTEA